MMKHLLTYFFVAFAALQLIACDNKPNDDLPPTVKDLTAFATDTYVVEITVERIGISFVTEESEITLQKTGENEVSINFDRKLIVGHLSYPLTIPDIKLLGSENYISLRWVGDSETEARSEDDYPVTVKSLIGYITNKTDIAFTARIYIDGYNLTIRCEGSKGTIPPAPELAEDIVGNYGVDVEKSDNYMAFDYDGGIIITQEDNNHVTIEIPGLMVSDTPDLPLNAVYKRVELNGEKGNITIDHEDNTASLHPDYNIDGTTFIKGTIIDDNIDITVDIYIFKNAEMTIYYTYRFTGEKGDFRERVDIAEAISDSQLGYGEDYTIYVNATLDGEKVITNDIGNMGVYKVSRDQVILTLDNFVHNGSENNYIVKVAQLDGQIGDLTLSFEGEIIVMLMTEGGLDWAQVNLEGTCVDSSIFNITGTMSFRNKNYEFSITSEAI